MRFASKYHTFLEVGLDPKNIPNTKPEEVFGRLGTKQPNMLKLESFTETTLKYAFSEQILMRVGGMGGVKCSSDASGCPDSQISCRVI